MALGLTNILKVARAEANRDAIDAAVAPGRVQLYGNARPATAGDPAGASPLVEIELQKPCGNVSPSGVLTITPPTDAVQIPTTGAPTWARFVDGDGNALFDCDAGTVGTEVIVDQETLYAGAFVMLISATFAEGG